MYLGLSPRERYEYDIYGIPLYAPYSDVEAAMAHEEVRRQSEAILDRRRLEAELDSELDYYQAHPTKPPMTPMPREGLFDRHNRDMQEDRRKAAVAFNAEYARQGPYDGYRSIDPRSGYLDAREQAAAMRMRAAREEERKAEMEAAAARARAAAANVTSGTLVSDQVENGLMAFKDKEGNTFYANPEAQAERDSVGSLTSMMSRLNPFGGGKKYRLKRFRKSRRHNKSNPHNKSRRAKKSRKTKRIR